MSKKVAKHRWQTAWHEGVREIFTHWVRTLLTMIGIVMSVSALVGMVALNEGIARGKRESAMQSGTLTKISIRNADNDATGTARGLFSAGLVSEDAATLRAAIPELEWVSPLINYNERVINGNRSSSTRIIAGTPDVALMDRYLPPKGRFISMLDLQNRTRVCVLGGTTAKELFNNPEKDAIGKKVIIRGLSFTIVGVLPEHFSESELRKMKQGVNASQAKRRQELREQGKKKYYDPYWFKNSMVVIPITTALATFNSAKLGPAKVDQAPIVKISELQVGFASDANRVQVVADIRRWLLHAHQGVEDFEIQPPDDSLTEIDQEIRSNRLTGGVIAGISLLVGGLGIVNIMLASITDRTREIGIRRALGASGSDIFRQVLIESICIAIIGGLLGIGGSLLLLRTLEFFSPPTNAPVLSWGIVIFGVASAAVIGIVAGVYPAAKASKLTPTLALTSE